MAELHIQNLKCVKRHDPTGKDEAKLVIDGRTVSGPHSLGKGDDAPSIDHREPFTGSVQVTLIEEDIGSDDDLGTVTITETEAGLGVRHGYFMAKTHASYDMTYDVHS
jgi:hypothetical protein